MWAAEVWNRPCGDAMEVTEGRLGGATTLRIAGRVDSSVSQILEQRVLDVVSRDGRLVVDLVDMNYISSAGLRCFIILAKHARLKNQVIALSGMREEVSEIFEISGLLQLFAIYDTAEAAVAALPQ
jgi:anti-anti-sigma factor